MPRPSLKAERSEQIFAAFQRCVAQYGVDGASLERVADEAQLRRSMIRHFVGNRDALIDGLAKRLADHFTQDMHETVQQLPKAGAATTLIDWLFDPTYASNTEAVLALEALVAAAPRYPQVRQHLLVWFDDIADQFFRIVVSEYPSAKPRDCRDVAMGIIGIYFNTDSIEPLGLDDRYRQSARRAALRLLRTLQT